MLHMGLRLIKFICTTVITVKRINVHGFIERILIFHGRPLGVYMPLCSFSLFSKHIVSPLGDFIHAVFAFNLICSLHSALLTTFTADCRLFAAHCFFTFCLPLLNCSLIRDISGIFTNINNWLSLKTNFTQFLTKNSSHIPLVLAVIIT
jgi:hypothetical protein